MEYSQNYPSISVMNTSSTPAGVSVALELRRQKDRGELRIRSRAVFPDGAVGRDPEHIIGAARLHAQERRRQPVHPRQLLQARVQTDRPERRVLLPQLPLVSTP